MDADLKQQVEEMQSAIEAARHRQEQLESQLEEAVAASQA